MSDYIAPDYWPTSAVNLFGNIPRFGYTDDLTLLVTGEADYANYAYGIAFIPGIILAIFLLWLAFLCLFKCCGRRVGLLSGRRLKNHSPHWFARTLVMLSAAFALAAGAMYLMKATSSLYDTFDSIRDGAKDLSNLAVSITEIADDLIQAGEETRPIRDNLVEIIDLGVCSSFDSGNGEPIDIDEQAARAVDALTDLSDFTSTELEDIRNNFSSQFRVIEADVNEMLDIAQGYARISYYAIGIIALAGLLYLGAYMAWFGPRVFTLKTYFCFQTWIVLPLYFLTIVATAIFTSVIGATLVFNSDLCTSGEGQDPESLLKVVLDSNGITGTPRESIDHFVVSGCTSDFTGTDELDGLVANLEEGYVACNDFQLIMAADINTFERACGGDPGSLEPITTALNGMQVATFSFTEIGYDAQELLACQKLNSVYIKLMHGSVCTHMPETLAWMFCTMCIILLSGMMLFTLRAALLPDKIVNDDEYSDSYTDDDEEILANKYEHSVDTSLGLGHLPRHHVDSRRGTYSVGPSTVTSIDDYNFNESSATIATDINVRSDGALGYNNGKEEESASIVSTKKEAESPEEQQEVEVSRLPTADEGDVVVQVSTRNLMEGGKGEAQESTENPTEVNKEVV